MNPPLPTGLELHRSSGIIDGTPTAGHSSTVHTITAKGNGNYTGSVTAAITITVNPVSAQELPRSTAEFYQTGLRPDDYRTNFAAFSIQAESKTDYRLAVREKSKGEPDAQSIRDSAAAIIRTLNETPINVYLSFPMDASLFDAATEWLDTADNPILTHAMVEDAQLQADTDYALYAVGPKVIHRIALYIICLTSKPMWNPPQILPPCPSFTMYCQTTSLP